MKTITKHYRINASIEAVWQCLTDAEQMEAWGAGPASYSPNLGGTFNMWGDYLHGTVTSIEAQQTLEQDWVVDGMQEPSKALFELTANDDKTILTLTHSNIPDEMVDDLDVGWDDFYLGAIKDHLENN